MNQLQLLHMTEIDVASIPQLAKLTDLRKLNVPETQFTMAGIAAMRERLPMLHALSVY